ncbi:MAG: diaminopimelate aminotransferase [Gammaproteobacteria bacterium SG8_11]|nr:MAG: diaminopimelate aminotransferase [Gammaproteobacteria bacterium SG8_11]
MKRIEDLEGQMIDFQRKITSIKALSPISGGEGEWDKAMYIKDFLKENGFADIQQIDAPDKDAKNGKRPNLIARVKGKSNEKTIWLMSHMDVVPEGDMKKWDTNPWKVVVADGKIYGRGTEDNQQSLTSSVFTAIAFLNEDIQPEYDLGLILVADEETGSGKGLDYLMENHPMLIKGHDLIIVPDAGEPDGAMIEIAEKSIVWIQFTTKGKQTHASLPTKGINAFRAASNLVVRLEWLHEIFNTRDDVFDISYSTFEPTKKTANVPNINTIPGEDVFCLDCRLLPVYEVDDLLKEVRKICDGVEKDFNVKIEMETPQLLQAPPATPVDSEIVERLKKAIKEVYHVDAKPMGIGGGTVAAFFRQKKLPVAVWSTIDDVCHQPNEYAVISNMVNDAKVFAHVCLQK